MIRERYNLWKEGEIVAKKFYEKGYQTFVCTYTVNITGAAPLKDQPAKDLARASRILPCGSGLGGGKLWGAVYTGTGIGSCEDGEERADSVCRGRKKGGFWRLLTLMMRAERFR